MGQCVISRVAFLSLPLCLAVQLLSPCQGRFAVRFRSSSLWRLAILQESVTDRAKTMVDKPLVVFLSVRLLKNPNCAKGLFDSLPIDCHCPVLSMSDANPAKLPLLLLLYSSQRNTRKVDEKRQEKGTRWQRRVEGRWAPWSARAHRARTYNEHATWCFGIMRRIKKTKRN